MSSVDKSRFSGIESIRFTILDPNNKNGVWEEVSPTEVRLKANIRIKKEVFEKIAKVDIDKIRAILKEANTGISPFLKMAIIGMVSGIVLLLLAALGWFLYVNAQFRVYQDDQYKFSIKYPKSWKAVVHPRANVAVVFLRPKDTIMDALQENFNVTIQPLPDNVFTLAAFSATIKRQMTGVFGKSIHIIEDKPLHWDWREGREMALEAPVPDHLKMVNAWVLYRNQAYILTFLGDMHKYTKDVLLVNEMIRSLQLQ